MQNGFFNHHAAATSLRKPLMIYFLKIFATIHESRNCSKHKPELNQALIPTDCSWLHGSFYPTWPYLEPCPHFLSSYHTFPSLNPNILNTILNLDYLEHLLPMNCLADFVSLLHIVPNLYVFAQLELDFQKWKMTDQHQRTTYNIIVLISIITHQMLFSSYPK